MKVCVFANEQPPDFLETPVPEGAKVRSGINQ